jgi:hypothetical protein
VTEAAASRAAAVLVDTHQVAVEERAFGDGERQRHNLLLVRRI